MLAWIDLEMTGLDPRRHVIVEIASILTDDDLEIIAEGPDLVIYADAEQLAEMDDFVTDMHARSGLTEKITASTLSLADAEEATMSFLGAHIDEAGSIPLAGNSIGTDRRFLAAQMPRVEDFLHYRCVDVSTIKELARRWYPEALALAPTKQGTHRALDDIKESIDELRHYRATVFRPDHG
jgi:oligoribonuclease